MFWAPRPSNFEAKLTQKKGSQADQKSSKNLVSILIQFFIDFGANLARFGEGFGSQVGAKLGPNATNTRPQNQSKKNTTPTYENHVFLKFQKVSFSRAFN